jgi:CDP-diacylglycerol---serine O-phosphatidyltransferase
MTEPIPMTDPIEPLEGHAENEQSALPKQGMRRKGVYLLPNALTTTALFAGFYAIVQAMNQSYEQAAIAIFIAMVFDALDGRVARLTNTQSAFGAEYDSLSDMVSFGVAPALIVYEWSLKGLGKFGWLAAFVYCAAAALRLARFNTNSTVLDKRFFQGLPSPAAAGLVAGTVWLNVDNHVLGTQVPWFIWVTTLFAGVSMVSGIPFYSFKDVNFIKAVPFVMLLLIVLGFVVVSSYPALVLFGVFWVYAVSAYILALVRKLQKRKKVVD